jgi:hypothetical protein
MTVNSNFGNIIPPARIEQAVEETLKTWIDTYNREIERQEGLPEGTLTNVGAWSRKSYFENITGDEFLPWVGIVSPGLADRPRKQGGMGKHHAKWRLDIGVVVSEPEDPRQLAGYWVASLRTCLLQKKCDGLDAAVSWVGERYDDLSALLERSLGGGRIQFEVEVYDVVTGKHGPPQPSPDPDPVPIAQDANVEVHKEDLP